VAALPGARLRWIDGASTFSPLDRPDAVAEATAELINTR